MADRVVSKLAGCGADRPGGHVLVYRHGTFQQPSAIALIVLLIAVLPANIYASMVGATLGGAPVTPLWPRVGIQALFVALLWWSGVRSNGLEVQ